MRVHISHIAKEDFLPAFYKAYDKAMTTSNIQAGFRATGLVPYDPEYVISQLDVKLRTPSPPGSSAGLPPAWVPKTPNNPIEFDLHSEFISNRIIRHQNSSPTSILRYMQQLKKGFIVVAYN
jgi:hypothetical protein